MATKRVKPRTFFLNETHELSLGEKGGGGRLPKYSEIDWQRKGRRISESLQQVTETVKESSDPLRDSRYFVLADPVKSIKKRREDKHGNLKEVYEEETRFGADRRQSRTFDRLGLDLLQVTADGHAVIHAERSTIESLRDRAAELAALGPLEQSRWATIDRFSEIPFQLRVDEEWVNSLARGKPTNLIIELQPVLRRLEADRVLHAVADLLRARSGESVTGTGTDYSGRHWLRVSASRGTVSEIARDFYSVQSIHPPLYSIAAGVKRSRAGKQVEAGVANEIDDVGDLPSVALIDLGVPRDHSRLAHYRRGNQFVPRGAATPPLGTHGSLVASRLVFGRCEDADELFACEGTCRFFDAMVGENPHISGRTDRVDNKLVLESMGGVAANAPDVRVYNLSFGDTRPLSAFPDVERGERLRDLQDLDNFAFENDVLVVVAAGNSAPGVIPSRAYPNHLDDPQWALGPWACGFNTLVCGAYVGAPAFGGVVSEVGWPSPHTRIGPGICGCPVPGFGAEGGDVDENYQYSAGLGVWCISNEGLAEDHSGTSFAAPLLAREAAFALRDLEEFCESRTHPFAVTARAFLSITARPPVADDGIGRLANRTLGLGEAGAGRLRSPTPGSAVILWQGYIQSPKDIVRVQLPVPLHWLNHAREPRLRILACSDPPVNAAAPGLWACRRMALKLRPGPEERALSRPSGEHDSFPVLDRCYRLNKFREGGDREVNRDDWLVELSYEGIAPYYAGAEFDPRQRVAFAAELFDECAEPVDPQPALQALPIAATMNRLSIQTADVRTPIILRTR